MTGKEYLCGRSLTGILPHRFSDSWSLLVLWDEFPADDHEFWLHVAWFCRHNDIAIPSVLECVSDTAVIAERMGRFERKKQVAHWQNYFQAAPLPEYSVAEAGIPAAKSDLRLHLEKDGAFLELLEPPRSEFRRLSQSEFHAFARRINDGDVDLNIRAEMLWSHLSHRAYSNYSLRLKYDDAQACTTLYRIFDSPTLREAVITEAGEALVWSPEPLRWHLEEPDAAVDNSYHLILTHADGTKVEGLVFALNGSPAYYLVNGMLCPGPPFDPQNLDPREGVALPAEAVEQREGIAFLHRIGAPLPERLGRRIREVRLRPQVTCSLQKGFQEFCVITIQSVTDNGEVVESWNNRQWLPAPGNPLGSMSRDDEVVTVSRRLLSAVPAIMDPLGLPRSWDGQYRLQVGKRFPQRFDQWLDSLPPHVEVRLLGELSAFRQPATAGSLSLNIEESEIDWFDLSVAVEVEDTDLTPEEIRLLLNAKGDWVRLDRKGWRRLAFELSAEADEQLARLGLNPRELDAEPQRLHALQLAHPAAQKLLPEEQSQKLRLRAEEIQARVTPEIPDTIEAELRPYQTEGFHFLAYLTANRFGGILADDMGLGKTLQTLTWLTWLRDQGQAGPTLVVCPKSVMDNWQAETERFTNGLSARVWRRSEADQLPARSDEADLHVINYTQLRKLGESLHSIRFLAVILDEGQYIKNPSSQTAQAARGLNAVHRLVLTGTPIENRLLDLWSLMTFAMPGVLGSRSQFGKLYNAKDDPFARLRLSSRVRPFLIRRTKAQVARDLPDRIEEDLYCEIEGEQRKLYQAERKRAQQILLGLKTQKQLNELRFNILTSLLHLRQICCHPRLFHQTTRAKSAKVEALREQLEPIMEEGNKVLVFSQFVELLDLVEPEMKKAGWPLWKLTGSTENRGQLVDTFQDHDGPGVFLISLKAGGSGLNLTAASYVVLFDPWWNPAVENQAIDRTHRIGQTAKVIAYRLLIKNSIEEKIRELQKQKQALAEDVLGEEKFSQSLSLDDFKYLLSD